MSTGVSSADFDQIAADMGQTLTYYVLTKVTDEDGNETDTHSSTTKTLVFFNEENRYLFDKEGLLEVGDAYIMAPTSAGIKRYDQFIGPDGKTYRIENTIRRIVTAVSMVDYGVCYVIQ